MPASNLPVPGPAATTGDAERDNLLQIIHGTTDLMEDIWTGDHGSAKYVAMLRASIQRDAAITSHFVEQSTYDPAAAASGVAVADEPALADDPRDEVRELQVSSTQARSRRPRILTVDDEPAAQQLFRDLLCTAGYEAVAAQSGFECLDLVARDGAFDVVVLDLTMPFIDGEETFRHLRNLAPHLPVLLTTAFIDSRRLDALFKAGLFAFLRKPLAPDEFLHHIARAVHAYRGAREIKASRGTAAAQ
jgi:CheY-like chemotaxis protein